MEHEKRNGGSRPSPEKDLGRITENIRESFAQEGFSQDKAREFAIELCLAEMRMDKTVMADVIGPPELSNDPAARNYWEWSNAFFSAVRGEWSLLSAKINEKGEVYIKTHKEGGDNWNETGHAFKNLASAI